MAAMHPGADDNVTTCLRVWSNIDRAWVRRMFRCPSIALTTFFSSAVLPLWYPIQASGIPAANATSSRNRISFD